MEKLRADRLCACGVMIQKNVRMFIHRKRYRTMRNAAMTIQRYSRGLVARRLVITILTVSDIFHRNTLLSNRITEMFLLNFS